MPSADWDLDILFLLSILLGVLNFSLPCSVIPAPKSKNYSLHISYQQENNAIQ